jgi:ferredoxin
MIRIDEARCAGCGICAGACPQGIDMKAGKASIKDQKAAYPRGAIILGEGESTESADSGPGWYGRGQGRGVGGGGGRGL